MWQLWVIIKYDFMILDNVTSKVKIIRILINVVTIKQKYFHVNVVTILY